MKKIRITLALALSAALAACGGNTEPEVTETVTETSVVAEVKEVAATTAATTAAAATTTSTTTSAATTTTTLATTTAAPEPERKKPTVIPDSELTEEQKYFLDNLNAYRAQYDAEAVELTEELNECAKELTKYFSKNLSSYLHHTLPDGSSYTVLIDETGFYYTDCEITNGYSLSYNTKAAATYYNCDSIASEKVTRPQWKYAGYWYDPDNLYWVMLFATDEEA